MCMYVSFWPDFTIYRQGQVFRCLSEIWKKKFKLSASEPVCNFYKSINGILYRCKGQMDEMVLLQLFDVTQRKPLLCFMQVKLFHLLRVNVRS